MKWKDKKYAEKEEELKDEEINMDDLKTTDEELEDSEKKVEVKKEPTKDEVILALNSEVESWKNKYYEAFANLDNTRKQMEKDEASFVKYCGAEFIKGILPVLDSFQHSLKIKPTDESLLKYYEGFEMILKQLQKVLADNHVTEIDPAVGDEFSEKTMQAMATSPGDTDNLVSNVYLKGYLYHDRIVRPAMVIVSKKADAEPEKVNQEAEASKN